MNDAVSGGQASAGNGTVGNDPASIEARAARAFTNFMGFEQKAPQKPKIPPAPQIEQPEPEGNSEPEQQADEETQAAPQEPETFEFEDEGETYVLPKKLEKAFMQQRDYTQKSQKNAELARSFEFLHEQARAANQARQFESEIAADIQQIQALDSVISQPVNLQGMTTEELLQRREQIDQWRVQRDKLAREVHAKHSQFMAKQKESIEGLKTKAKETLGKTIPNWSDATWDAVRTHAKNDGYTDAELNDVLDPRHQQTLWKAQQYDLLKSKAQKTVVDVKAIKTTSSNPMPQAVKAKLAFNKQIQKTAPGSHERNKLIEQRVEAIFSKR